MVSSQFRDQSVCLICSFCIFKAFYYFKKAADDNHSKSAYNCAIYCLKYKKLCTGLKYLRLASKDNHEESKRLLAILLIRHQLHYDEAFALLSSMSSSLVNQFSGSLS
jgi:hypothetical protein